MTLCVTELLSAPLPVFAMPAFVSGNAQEGSENIQAVWEETDQESEIQEQAGEEVSDHMELSGSPVILDHSAMRSDDANTKEAEQFDFSSVSANDGKDDNTVSGNTPQEEGGDQEQAQQPPGAPSLTSVAADTYQSVALTCQGVANASGYEIFRGISPDGSDAALLKTVEGTLVSPYTDTSLKTGTTYYYKIRAYLSDEAGEKIYGDFSLTMSATPMLNAPNGLLAKQENYQSVSVTWNPVTGADGYEIFFAPSASGSYQSAGTVPAGQTLKFSHNKPVSSLGAAYYYKVCAYRIVDGQKVYSPQSVVVSASTTLGRAALTKVKGVNYKTMEITYKKVDGASGYEIYRSTKSGKGFKKIGTVKKAATLRYKDKKCKTGVTYYYKVRAYRTVSGGKKYGEYSKEKKGATNLARPVIKKAALVSVDTASLSWKKVSGAKGYIVYRGTSKSGKYKKVLSLKGAGSTSCQIGGQENGSTCYYKVRAYYTAGGKQKYSPDSAAKSVLFNVYGYEKESYQDRARRIFGTDYYQKYSSKEIAAANMTTISIAVWDFNASKTAKVTKYKSLTVNKNIAPTVQQIFKEIYEGPEKFPIKSIGCFSWRGDSSYSEHNQGLAIDINPEENYMIDGGVILSGKYWKPGEDPYSIPEGGDVEKIMLKYGFFRGFWGDRRDYMHFSYFGT